MLTSLSKFLVPLECTSTGCRNYILTTGPYPATLALSDNKLDGTIPSEIGKLITLRKSFYCFVGCGLLPDHSLIYFLVCATFLFTAYLSLYNNTLEGTIPSEVGSMISVCKQLSLFALVLTRLLPIHISLPICFVVHLPLFNNALTGAIPSEVGRLTSLCKPCNILNLLVSLPYFLACHSFTLRHSLFTSVQEQLDGHTANVDCFGDELE
jgi:hypothetical protein